MTTNTLFIILIRTISLFVIASLVLLTLTSIAQTDSHFQRCDSLHKLVFDEAQATALAPPSELSVQKKEQLIYRALMCDSSYVQTYIILAGVYEYRQNDAGVLHVFQRIDEILNGEDMITALKVSELSFQQGNVEAGREAANRALRLANAQRDDTDDEIIQRCANVFANLLGKLEAEKYVNSKKEFLDDEFMIYLLETLEMGEAWTFYHQKYGLAE